MELYPLSYVIVISVVFGIETFLGLTLNLYTLVKWFKSRKNLQQRRNNNGCHFVITLKILDFVICATVIPLALFVQVIDKEDNLVPCLMKEGLVIMATSCSSVCVMLVSIDRYVAVVLPTRTIMTAFRVKICKVFICFTALTGSALPSLCFVTGSNDYGMKESVKHKSCRHIIWLFKPFYMYDLFNILPFAVAFITTGICYKSVLNVVKFRLRQRITRVRVNTVSPISSAHEAVSMNRFRAQEIKVQRVAFAATLSFLVCWGPHVAITIVQCILPRDALIDEIQSAVLSLAFLTPIIHPLLYKYETSKNRRRQNLTIHGILTDLLRLRRRNTVVPVTARQ